MAGSPGSGLSPSTRRWRTPPSSVMARSAISAGNALPCQPSLFSISLKPLPLTVHAVTVDIGFPFVFGGSALAEPVDVEDGGEIREPVVARLVEALPDRSLSQLAIAGERPDMVGQLVELATGERDADGDRQPLAERPGRDIDPGQDRRGMSLQPRSELAEGEQLVIADHA